MTLMRIMVHVDPDDLAIIKEAAAVLGIPEAEILREGIHLAALRARRVCQWTTPMNIPVFSFAPDAAARSGDASDECHDRRTPPADL